jgi:hypothetical protein
LSDILENLKNNKFKIRSDHVNESQNLEIRGRKQIKINRISGHIEQIEGFFSCLFFKIAKI